MATIENEQLKVSILPKGAELNSIYNKKTGLEYLWGADPAFWAKRSPILFPIVGTLKDDSYDFDGKSYKLSRHGFARDLVFDLGEVSPASVIFTLTSSELTLQKFPFPFRFDIIYSLNESRLKVTYKVHNTGDRTMYFSVGGHPAFKLPLEESRSYTDYYLEFNKKEEQGRWLISKEGLIELTMTPLLESTNRLALKKELFYKDAIVLKHLRSTKVKLLCHQSPHGFEFDFTGFPYLGIWAAKDADFVCIEPWCGIADSIDSTQELQNKEGINALPADASFERSWSFISF